MKNKRRLPTEAEWDRGQERRLEIENRLRNLFWTVSGDYTLSLQPDVGTFLRSQDLALYDAIKQGAFASHFDARALALYTLKKQALGADRATLTEIAQLCVDAAAYPLASRERRGVEEIRRRAFRDLLEIGYFRGTLGQLRKSLILRFLENTPPPAELAAPVAAVEALAEAAGTEQILQTIDALYNTLGDPAFAEVHGDLQAVQRVTPQALAEYQRGAEISDAHLEAVLEEYLSAAKEELLRTGALRSPAHRPTALLEPEEEPVEPAPQEAAKVRAYMERQFGKSFLSPEEQAQWNRQMCTGIHRRCTLYFTQGVLQNPVVKNNQYLRTQMQSLKNEMYFQMKLQPIRRSVAQLGAMLKQAQIQRQDQDLVRGEEGQIVPARLWRVGRTEPGKLFDRREKRDRAGFAVDLLLDSSGSQTLRQPQIAAQAYIISQALSLAGIPHRVCGFCSYWDYTLLHRFRDYQDPPEANKAILQFRAFGENRDGLAIRAICQGLQARPEENKLLILLSDGRPNHLGSNRPGCRRPAPYVGEAAVKDTALEVRKARAQGIGVLGVFVGSPEDLYAEKKIFGKEFIYSRNIRSFAHIVGTYLRSRMEQ